MVKHRKQTDTMAKSGVQLDGVGQRDLRPDFNAANKSLDAATSGNEIAGANAGNPAHNYPDLPEILRREATP